VESESRGDSVRGIDFNVLPPRDFGRSCTRVEGRMAGLRNSLLTGVKPHRLVRGFLLNQAEPTQQSITRFAPDLSGHFHR